MPRIFRSIRKARCRCYPDVEWLAPDAVQADALRDLQPRDNVLSFWLIEDSGANLERVVAAVASTRDQLANVDYALVDLSELERLGVSMEKSKGTSADDAANDFWHYDLTSLSAQDVVRISETIAGAPLERVQQKRVLSLIKTGVGAGQIKSGELRDGVVRRLTD